MCNRRWSSVWHPCPSTQPCQQPTPAVISAECARGNWAIKRAFAIQLYGACRLPSTGSAEEHRDQSWRPLEDETRMADDAVAQSDNGMAGQFVGRRGRASSLA